MPWVALSCQVYLRIQLSWLSLKTGLSPITSSPILLYSNQGILVTRLRWRNFMDNVRILASH